VAKSFQQTDTAPACATTAACSGAAIANIAELLCSEGGTPGESADSFGAGAGSSNQACVFWELAPDDGDSWDAGDYVVRINVTSGNSSLTWVATYVCRLNSSCVNQETIGNLTGQAIGLGSTGVKSMTVAGSAVAPAAGDKIYIVCVFDSAGAHGNNTAQLVPDQLIDTPLTAAAAGQGSTPDPAIATAAAIDPAVTAGGVSATPDPAVATATAVDPSASAGGGEQEATPEPAVSTATAPDPSTTIGGVSSSPAPVAASASAVGPSVTIGGVSAVPDPATAAFTAIDPASETGNVTATPDPATATATAPDPSVTTGGEIVPAPAIATAAAIDPVASAGGVTATPDPAPASATAIDPLVSTGSVATPDPATATLAAPAPAATAGGLVATPTPAGAATAAIDPAAAPGGVSAQPAPATTAVTAIEPTVSQGREASPYPAIATAGAIEPTVSLGGGTITPAPAVMISLAIDPLVAGGASYTGPDAAFVRVVNHCMGAFVHPRQIDARVTARVLRVFHKEPSMSHWKLDEVGSLLQLQILDRGNAPIDLTDATVSLTVVKPDGTTKVTWSMTIADATGGRIERAFAAGDLDQVGTYQAEVVIARPGDAIDYAPSRGVVNFYVQARL
jgi:hypothetical protein